MAKKNDWKKREGVVYSTSGNFEYSYGQSAGDNTLPPARQDLRISLDRKMRAGKQATLVTGYVGTAPDLEELTKLLKMRCGVGGSAKEGTIIIQGDVRKKVLDILLEKGYKAKLSG
jgi:translation initiation factor 1